MWNCVFNACLSVIKFNYFAFPFCCKSFELLLLNRKTDGKIYVSFYRKLRISTNKLSENLYFDWCVACRLRSAHSYSLKYEIDDDGNLYMYIKVNAHTRNLLLK